MIASIPGYFAEYLMIKGKIELPEESEGVTGKDIVDLLQVAKNTKDLGDREMVTIIPIDFNLDETTGIKDPKGMKGKILETRAVMITTPKKNIYSVISLLENNGLEVIDVSLNSIGDINAAKDKTIKQQVGAVINIGHETTTVSLYNKGIIVKSSVLGLGGKNVDNDIAYIYKLELKDAAKIKERFALAHKHYASHNDYYEIVNKLGKDKKINQFGVSEVAMSRLEEILILAQKKLIY